MTVVGEGSASTLSCVDCGRALLSGEEERRWAKCRFCGKPVCFGCIRYVGTTIRGPYMDYIEALRTCNKCYVRKG